MLLEDTGKKEPDSIKEPDNIKKLLTANAFRVLREENWSDPEARDSMAQMVATLREIPWTQTADPAWATEDGKLAQRLIAFLPIARSQWCAMQRQLQELKEQNAHIPNWQRESEQILLAFIEELEKLEFLFGAAPEPEDEDLPVGPPPSIGEIMGQAREDMRVVRIEIGADLVEPKTPTPFRATL